MRVPTLDLATAAPAPVAGAQVVETRPDYTSADMLAQSGVVATKALQAAEEAAKDAKRIRETQALAEYHSAANTLNYGTSDEAEAKRFGVQVNSGFLQTQGEEAPAQSAAHLAKLAKYRDDIANRFDAADREALLAKLEPIHQDASLTTERHVGQQIAVVHRNASTTLQAEVLRGIANEPTSPTAWLTLAKTEQQLEELKVPQAEREQFRGLFHATAIDGLVRGGNIDAAETRFEAAKPQLSPQQIDRIDDQLKRARATATKEGAAREAEGWAQVTIDESRVRVDPTTGERLDKQHTKTANRDLAYRALATIADPVKQAAAREALDRNFQSETQKSKARLDLLKNVVFAADAQGQRPRQDVIDALADTADGDPEFLVKWQRDQEALRHRREAHSRGSRADQLQAEKLQKEIDDIAYHRANAMDPNDLADSNLFDISTGVGGVSKRGMSALEQLQQVKARKLDAEQVKAENDFVSSVLKEAKPDLYKKVGKATVPVTEKVGEASIDREVLVKSAARTAYRNLVLQNKGAIPDSKALDAERNRILQDRADTSTGFDIPLLGKFREEQRPGFIVDQREKLLTPPALPSHVKPLAPPQVTTKPMQKAVPPTPAAQNQKALDWAHAHPDDPRSAAILHKLGAQ